jgi:hypothetical protein
MSNEDKVDIVDVKDPQVSWRPNSRIYLLALPIILTAMWLAFVSHHEDEEDLQLGFTILTFPIVYPITIACVTYSICIFRHINSLKIPPRILFYTIFLVNAYLLFQMAKLFFEITPGIIEFGVIDSIALLQPFFYIH